MYLSQQYIVIEQSALQVDLKHLYLIKSIQRKSRQMIHWLLPLTMKVKILIKNLLFQERRLQTVPQYTSDISMEKSFGHQFSLIRFISLQLLVNYQNFPVCNVYLIRLLILIETIAKKPFQRTFILILCFPHFTIIEN